jgi:hypothetical protein
MNSSMPALFHVMARSPFSRALSIAFICALSSGFSTSSIVCSMWLYRKATISREPIHWR